MCRKFILLIGLPGCGKSYYASNFLGSKKTKIVSSDSIRKELYGSEEVQGDPKKVFSLLFDRSKEYLSSGYDVIYDATNINMKKRCVLVQNLKTQLKEPIYVKYIVWAAPYEYCLYQNSKRDRQVPKEIIKRMYYNFEFPLESEGYDSIEIIRPEKLGSLAEKYQFDLYQFLSKKLDERPSHDNPNHLVDITTHMELAFNYENEHYSDVKNHDIRYWALMYHDIGKFKTKTIKNGIAHYYNHANVGAYDYMCINASEETAKDCKMFFDILRLINYHMRPFDWDKNPHQKENESKRYFDHIYNDLLLMHESDIHCEDLIKSLKIS